MGAIPERELDRILDAETFLHVFYWREREHPERVFLRQPTGATWKEYTFAEVANQARRMAAALRELGVVPGDRVGIISKNCAHWIIADLAILMSGCVSVPYYPTLSADSLAELVRASDIRALFVGKLDAWDTQASGVPADLPRIAFPHHPGNSRVLNAESWEAVLARTEPLAQVHQPKATDPFTIIYTSGTTGSPKGVVLSYDSPRQIARHERRVPAYGLFGGAAERLFSYLPLNHIAERFATEIVGIQLGSLISFSESLERFAQNLRDVQPTLFFAVPRIWTKMREGITKKIPERYLSVLLRTPLVGRLLRRQLGALLGLGKAKLVISGAAPLAASTLEWFWRLGVPIREVYGMSETGGGVTLTPVKGAIAGTVGPALPGATIRLADETSEVLIRAPWIMTGYFRDPEKTRELMPDGFIRSGDRGRFDAEGNLVIVGRISEAFKGAKGRYVVPTGIEERFAGEPLIEQVMVTGRGLTQPIALICLTEDGKALPRTELQARLSRLRDRVNAALDNYEKLAALVVMEQSFSVENGALTPTLKLRRHAIDARYEPHYERWGETASIVFAEL
jgi:long-subunit acyl-CoA synthetase (AMP-forming)